MEQLQRVADYLMKMAIKTDGAISAWYTNGYCEVQSMIRAHSHYTRLTIEGM